MDELELLKKDWNKKSDDFKEYSENEIYGMIKNKSVSMTKTLLFIGLVEVVLWTLYGYLDNQFPYTRMGLFLVFTGLIIYQFCRMKVGHNTISLMKSILNLRRLILGYACISLILTIVDSLIHFDHNARDFTAGWKDGWNERHDIKALPADPETIIPVFGNYVAFGIFLLIGFYLLYIVYKRTYLKILQGLRKNYKELSYHEEKPF